MQSVMQFESVNNSSVLSFFVNIPLTNHPLYKSKVHVCVQLHKYTVHVLGWLYEGVYFLLPTWPGLTLRSFTSPESTDSRALN